MSILITTIYKGSAVIQAIKELNPSKVYFLVDETGNDIRKNAIMMAKDYFPNVEYKEEIIKTYDLVDIAQKSCSIIHKEAENKIFIHVSEGRKTMSFGLLFAGYLMKKNIDSAYYIMEETNKLVKLPLFELKISNKKEEILSKISNEINSVQDLEKELGIKASTLYVHLKELRDDGFISKDLQLTDLGKIVLLNIGKRK